MSTQIGQPTDALDTPALLVELDTLQRNLERMANTIIREAGVAGGRGQGGDRPRLAVVRRRPVRGRVRL